MKAAHILAASLSLVAFFMPPARSTRARMKSSHVWPVTSSISWPATA
jgi:hypothetical protein